MMQSLVLIGAAVQSFGIFLYIKETLRGNTKPNRVTWLMWAVAPLIGAAAAFMDGAGWAAIPVFAAGFGALLVFIASFINPNSYWKLGRFDYLCGLFSILALIFWGITKEPIVAIIFAMVSDGFAALPTLIKSWRYPETEIAGEYMAALFSAFTGFFVIKIWNFSSYALPVYFVFINAFLIFAVYRKKIFKNAPDVLKVMG